MRVGLINIEPKIHNTAYMQIAAWHRGKGHEVDWYSPLYAKEFDIVYCSSLFEATDKSQVPRRANVGGTGFRARVGLGVRLPGVIEDSPLDYSIYPDCMTSYIWFSRGCKRRCPFCCVQDKEGDLHSVEPKNLNPKGTMITVQDNSFFENPEWEDACGQLFEWGQPVDLTNINVRAITSLQCEFINGFRLAKRVKIAWDNPLEDIRDQLAMMTSIVKPRKIMCYVLIGYWSDPQDDMMRVETLRSFGIDPYVMVFGKPTAYSYHFQRWVNRKELFKSVPWNEYRRHKTTGKQIMEAMK